MYIDINNIRLYLIVNEDKKLELINKQQQTYFIIKDPDNILFEELKNGNLENVYHHIDSTWYFITDRYNDNIFLLAAIYGYIDIIQYYLYLGLDVDYQNNDGDAALIYAIIYPNVVEFLLNSGADPNIKNNVQMTALHYASKKENIDIKIVKLLLKYGVNVNIQDEFGFTSLMYAANPKGNINIVNLLLQYEADPNILNMHKLSAIFYAIINKRYDICKLLIKHGAKYN